MKHYCYCIVTDEGDSFAVDADLIGMVEVDGDGEMDEVPLGRLLSEGWVPVRETSLGNGYALVLLSRD